MPLRSSIRHLLRTLLPFLATLRQLESIRAPADLISIILILTVTSPPLVIGARVVLRSIFSTNQFRGRRMSFRFSASTEKLARIRLISSPGCLPPQRRMYYMSRTQDSRSPGSRHPFRSSRFQNCTYESELTTILGLFSRRFMIRNFGAPPKGLVALWFSP